MLAILILFITGILTMFASFFPKKNMVKYIALIGILLTLFSLNHKYNLNINFPDFFEMTNNKLARMMMVVSLFILFFIVLLSGKYEKNYDWSATISLMLFSTTGAILLFGMTHLLTLFLGIEILSIPLYVMAASKRNSAYSLEAGLKYFILGSFSSAFLLFGIALVYGTFGSFQINMIVQIQQMFTQGLPIYFHIGVMMIILSIVFKMALAPFHFWSPDVYEGSPTLVTAYMTTIVKMSATIAMYYILGGFFAYQYETITKYLIIIVGLSFFIGSVLGLVQQSVKRLLAYSSISHAAFILLTIILAMAFQNPGMITFYLIAYTVSSLSAFLIINEISNGDDLRLDDLNGFGKTNPLLALGLMIAILSMAGIPLTGGFIAKFAVLSKLFVFHKWLFVLAILASAIGIAYYLKVINRMYFFENNTENVAIKNIFLSISVAILSVIIIVLGIAPSLIPTAIQTYFF